MMATVHPVLHCEHLTYALPIQPMQPFKEGAGQALRMQMSQAGSIHVAMPMPFESNCTHMPVPTGMRASIHFCMYQQCYQASAGQAVPVLLLSLQRAYSDESFISFKPLAQATSFPIRTSLAH